MTHGAYGYSRGCRCNICRGGKRTQAKRGAAHLNLTPEQRRHCLICGTALNVHPIKACWREVS